MKIYLASCFSLKERVDMLKEYLEHNGHTITVKWWLTNLKEAFGDIQDDEWYNLPDIKHIHDKNFKGIDDADILIIVAPEGNTIKFNGANIELGYALAKGKKVMAFGDIERSAMYWAVEKHTTIQGIIESLHNAPSESKDRNCPKCKSGNVWLAPLSWGNVRMGCTCRDCGHVYNLNYFDVEGDDDTLEKEECKKETMKDRTCPECEVLGKWYTYKDGSKKLECPCCNQEIDIGGGKLDLDYCTNECDNAVNCFIGKWPKECPQRLRLKGQLDSSEQEEERHV